MTTRERKTEDSYTFDQQGCARCDGDGHSKMTYVRLARPIELPDSRHKLTHWATCPTTGEPILMAFLDDEDDIGGSGVLLGYAAGEYQDDEWDYFIIGILGLVVVTTALTLTAIVRRLRR